MPCAVCSSANEVESTTEKMIHFSRLKRLTNPGLLIFPKVSICLDCGFSWFTLPETELESLGKAFPTANANPLAS